MRLKLRSLGGTPSTMFGKQQAMTNTVPLVKHGNWPEQRVKAANYIGVSKKTQKCNPCQRGASRKHQIKVLNCK